MMKEVGISYIDSGQFYSCLWLGQCCVVRGRYEFILTWLVL